MNIHNENEDEDEYEIRKCHLCSEHCTNALHNHESNHLKSYFDFICHMAEYTLNECTLDYVLLCSLLNYDNIHICEECMISSRFENEIWNERVVYPYNYMVKRVEVHAELKRNHQNNIVYILKRTFPQDIVDHIVSYDIF